MKYIEAKSIISHNKYQSWFGCKYNMNIYRGCVHGCIYCDSRSDCYHIENFDEVKGKKNAIEIIKKELKSKKKKGIVGTGAMSDPYNPYEKEYKLTRDALKLIDTYEFGINITTKSDLVTRDIDILKKIKKHSPVCIGITITAYTDEMSRKIETAVSSSSQRFETIKQLRGNGVYAGILMMPILPYITDSDENILDIVKKASESGANFIYPSFGMTLRLGQREYFYEVLEKEFPNLKKKYQKNYGEKYQCSSPNYKRLRYIFINECEKRNIYYKMKDIVEGVKKEVEIKQMSLF